MVVTIVYIIFWGKRLLPEYQLQKRPVALASSLEEISETYSLEGNIFWLNVLPGSGLAGQSLRQAGIGTNFRVTVIHIEAHQPEIERRDRVQRVSAVLQRLRQPEDTQQKKSLFARLFRTTYKAPPSPALPSPDTSFEVMEATHGGVPLPILLGVPETGGPGMSVSPDHHHPEEEYETWSFTGDQPLDGNKFRTMAESLPEGIIRAKGILYLQENLEQRYIFQLVGKRWSLKPGEAWNDQQPVSKLIIIGSPHSIDQTWLMSQLDISE